MCSLSRPMRRIIWATSPLPMAWRPRKPNAKKRLIDHAVHLTIHGTLHLLGYDHLRSREAQIMEALETRLLARLGIADPYARAKAAKR
jgi:hypothetical protein